jgi:thioredoxin reductase (NADPH)
MSTTPTERIKCLILGSGPAGYTAAIYAARSNMAPVVYEGLMPGGQLTTTTEIDNFPGYPEGVNGTRLMEDLRSQALRFDADIRFGFATAIDLSLRPFRVTIDGVREVTADTLIIATGANAKYLGLDSEQHFRGQGVSACATCDGFFYRGQDVAVVGGGDTAAEEATYLATICRKVYLVVRRHELRASKAMQDKVLNTPNVEVLWGHQTKEVLGNDLGVTGVMLVSDVGVECTVAVSGFFVAIGHHPNTDFLNGQVELDEAGYAKTYGGTSKTSVEGVFAAGDVQDPHYRQAITAAASGCKAALDAERYLKMCN